ncbi:MAG: hypothetical protein Q9179_001897 [Wetmoreana sp. 5 TL-2023]
MPDQGEGTELRHRAMAQSFRFRDLPSEIRNMIYRLCLVNRSPVSVKVDGLCSYYVGRPTDAQEYGKDEKVHLVSSSHPSRYEALTINANLIRINQITHHETAPILYGLNTFQFLGKYWWIDFSYFDRRLSQVSHQYIRKLDIRLPDIERIYSHEIKVSRFSESSTYGLDILKRFANLKDFTLHVFDDITTSEIALLQQIRDGCVEGCQVHLHIRAGTTYQPESRSGLRNRVKYLDRVVRISSEALEEMRAWDWRVEGDCDVDHPFSNDEDLGPLDDRVVKEMALSEPVTTETNSNLRQSFLERAVTSIENNIAPQLMGDPAVVRFGSTFLDRPDVEVWKRRVELVNDENADPESNVEHETQYDISADLDESDDPCFTSVKRSPRTGTSAAKAPVARCRKTVPLRKTNSSSEIDLQCTDENEIIQVPTPQTPRHRDALSKKVPITPRRFIPLAGKPPTPRTPRTPITPTSIPTVYHDVRQSFVRSADPGRLIGRESERSELETFIRGGLDRRLGGCLYVSGPPGTGKSALVREVCQDFTDGPELRKAYVNCMSVRASGDISRILSSDLFGRSEPLELEQTTNLRSLKAPQKKSSGPMYLVVLDEMDHLLNLDLGILYDLFGMSLRRNSHLILVGIANALDLTDRFLPRLKAKNLKPVLLPFLPYTAPQIASIITTKLRTLFPNDEGTPTDHVPFVHPTAIQFCSKKVASQTGDLRKAFDIIHHSLALVENETKQIHQRNISTPSSPSKSPLGENPNCSSPSKPRNLAASLATIKPLTAPRVTIAHVARVTASALGHGTSQRLQNLNLQQKAALCALISLEKHKRSPRWYSIMDTSSKSSTNSLPAIRDWYEAYASLCKRDNALHALTVIEFYDVVGGLETLGLVGKGDKGGLNKRTPKKQAGKREDMRISIWVSEKELETCLEGAGGAILRGLLASDD